MNGPRRLCHVPALVLAVVLAWPWNLALGLIDTSSGAAPIGRWSRGSERDPRVGGWKPVPDAPRATVVADLDPSEEGNDAGFADAGILTAPLEVRGPAVIPPGRGAAGPRLPGGLLGSWLARLRC